MNTWNTGQDSSDTGDTEVEENHNTWKALLEVLTMLGSSPPRHQGLQELGGLLGGFVVPRRVRHPVYVHTATRPATLREVYMLRTGQWQ